MIWLFISLWFIGYGINCYISYIMNYVYNIKFLKYSLDNKNPIKEDWGFYIMTSGLIGLFGWPMILIANCLLHKNHSFMETYRRYKTNGLKIKGLLKDQMELKKINPEKYYEDNLSKKELIEVLLKTENKLLKRNKIKEIFK